MLEGQRHIVHIAGNDSWTSKHDNWKDFFEKILEKVVLILELEENFTLSILLTENEQSQQLNRDFRNKDKPTNVLSFPSGVHLPLPDGTQFLGDLAFSFEVIDSEATENEKTFLNHMTHLAIHGILHLLGYDHETTKEAEEMETLEINILEHFEIRDPYL